ncbi:hypothetical protein ACIBG8_14845 [Nonomuraea sp. NPDC050556]|uniref:hypothetical protein n=1 Tax=Nonomuraea sp. NPDC050556 TaxID=3364369 RepID=UPI003790DDFA
MTFYVIADSACGGCSAIAAQLGQVLSVPVAVRSCRDPHLAEEFPVLAGEPACARPLAVYGGRLLGGAALMWYGARLLTPGRRLAGLRLAVEVFRLRLSR